MKKNYVNSLLGSIYSNDKENIQYIPYFLSFTIHALASLILVQLPIVLWSISETDLLF